MRTTVIETPARLTDTSEYDNIIESLLAEGDGKSLIVHLDADEKTSKVVRELRESARRHDRTARCVVDENDKKRTVTLTLKSKIIRKEEK